MTFCQRAEFHADLALPERCVVCRKGFNRNIDSYSAFFENDMTTATGLEVYLKGLGVKRVFVVGVAYDFCVRYTAVVRLRNSSRSQPDLPGDESGRAKVTSPHPHTSLSVVCFITLCQFLPSSTTRLELSSLCLVSCFGSHLF